MKTSRKILLTIVAMVAGGSAIAQEQSHVDAAKGLLELMDADQSIEQAYAQISTHLDTMARQMGITEEQRPRFERYTERMIVAMKEEMSWEKMEPHIVDVYVKVYTEEELRELSAFYASPIGQKFVAKMPELMEASLQMTQEMMGNFLPRMREIQEDMRAEFILEQAGEAQN